MNCYKLFHFHLNTVNNFRVIDFSFYLRFKAKYHIHLTFFKLIYGVFIDIDTEMFYITYNI